MFFLPRCLQCFLGNQSYSSGIGGLYFNASSRMVFQWFVLMWSSEGMRNFHESPKPPSKTMLTTGCRVRSMYYPAQHYHVQYLFLLPISFFPPKSLCTSYKMGPYILVIYIGNWDYFTPISGVYNSPYL